MPVQVFATSKGTRTCSFLRKQMVFCIISNEKSKCTEQLKRYKKCIKKGGVFLTGP